jgi:hypothetical protein
MRDGAVTERNALVKVFGGVPGSFFATAAYAPMAMSCFKLSEINVKRY